MDKFKVTSLGDLKYLLGIEIDYVPQKLLVFTQKKFTKVILEKYGSPNMNPVKNPLFPGADAQNYKEQSEIVKLAYPYRSLVGALQYLVTGSRLELAFAVRTLAKYVNSYTETHWKLATRVLKYLVATQDFGLVFDIEEARKQDGLQIVSWADSDWANDPLDRKSITGFVTQLNGQTIAAKCVKQDIVATSSTHAEIIASSTAARDVVWLEEILGEIGLEYHNSVQFSACNRQRRQCCSL